MKEYERINNICFGKWVEFCFVNIWIFREKIKLRVKYGQNMSKYRGKSQNWLVKICQFYV